MTRTPPPPRDGRSRPPLDDDAGIALVTVIGFSFIATLLVVLALGTAVNDLPAARLHQDRQAAVTAAQAGIDELVYRLDRDPDYHLTADPTNPAMTGWRDVPGGVGDAAYHYSIDASRALSNGFVDITSTGRANGVERTVQSRIRRRGFLDQIYLTDYEVLSGSVYFDDGDERLEFYDHHCRRHRDESWTDDRAWFSGDQSFGPLGARTGRLTASDAIAHYQSRATNPLDASTARSIVYANRLYCGDIAFGEGDIIEGPLHSNDGIAMRFRPEFRGLVTTAYRHGSPGLGASDLWVDINGTGNPYFQDGIASVPEIALPPTNTGIRTYAANGGCVYQGPTYLHLYVQAGVPKVTVHSPLTTDTEGTGCGPGIGLDLPANGVVYVEDATVACTSHPLAMDTLGTPTTYECGAGDAFVWGELDGQMTIAAEQDIRIVSDLTYAGDTLMGDDVLGLVANDFVWVHHPVVYDSEAGRWVNKAVRGNPPFVTPTFTDPRPPVYPDGADTWNDPVIEAAVVALTNSFAVEQWRRGSPYDGATGTDRHDLTVVGAIAQAVRGPVATSSGSTGNAVSGYEKDYRYDTRLTSLTPPFFIEPAQAAWVAREFAEIDEPPRCNEDADPLVEPCLPPFVP